MVEIVARTDRRAGPAARPLRPAGAGPASDGGDHPAAARGGVLRRPLPGSAGPPAPARPLHRVRRAYPFPRPALDEGGVVCEACGRRPGVGRGPGVAGDIGGPRPAPGGTLGGGAWPRRSAGRDRSCESLLDTQLARVIGQPDAKRPLSAGDEAAGGDLGRTRMSTPMDVIVSLSKRRGFIFQSSEIYGGTGSCWDYGPLGVELKNNIKRVWWRDFVQQRGATWSGSTRRSSCTRRCGRPAATSTTSPIRWWTAASASGAFAPITWTSCRGLTSARPPRATSFRSRPARPAVTAASAARCARSAARAS